MHYRPILARNWSGRRPVEPAAYDCVRVMVIRDGSAILHSEFGRQPVNPGDVVLLGANTLCGGIPEELVTVTTIYADSDFVVDQVYWQHVGMVQDRLEAQALATTIYTEPAQILRIGQERSQGLMPWLDELVQLSTGGHPAENFFRMQALWFSVTHVIAPFIKTSSVRTSPTQRATTWPTLPRHRQFSPLRGEAQRAAELLRAEPERRWSVTNLADQVHLSKGLFTIQGVVGV